MSMLLTSGSLAMHGARFVGSGFREFYNGNFGEGCFRLGLGLYFSAGAASTAYLAIHYLSHYLSPTSDYNLSKVYNLSQVQHKSDLPWCRSGQIDEMTGIYTGAQVATKHNLWDVLSGSESIKVLELSRWFFDDHYVRLKLGSNAPELLSRFWTLVDMPRFNCSLEVRTW